LRETAGLSIQQACDQGQLSANFWGKVERAEQEPCLLSICGLAKGLGISTQVLMTFDERPSGNSARNQINDFLDLCNSDQVELSLQIVKTIYEHRVPKSSSPDTQAL
jgi:transcriptional regulator with XRE-family HTH domain